MEEKSDEVGEGACQCIRLAWWMGIQSEDNQEAVRPEKSARHTTLVAEGTCRVRFHVQALEDDQSGRAVFHLVDYHAHGRNVSDEQNSALGYEMQDGCPKHMSHLVYCWVQPVSLSLAQLVEELGFSPVLGLVHHYAETNQMSPPWYRCGDGVSSRVRPQQRPLHTHSVCQA